MQSITGHPALLWNGVQWVHNLFSLPFSPSPLYVTPPFISFCLLCCRPCARFLCCHILPGCLCWAGGAALRHPRRPPRPREGPSPSLICRMSWLFWMLWIISRRTSFSCSTAVAASRRASTLRSAGDRTVTGGKPRLPHLSTAQSSSGVTTIRNTSQKLLTPFYFLFCNCFLFNPLALWLPVSSPLTGHSFYLVFIDLYSFLPKKSALMYLSIFNLFISHCFFLHSAAYLESPGSRVPHLICPPWPSGDTPCPPASAHNPSTITLPFMALIRGSIPAWNC